MYPGATAIRCVNRSPLILPTDSAYMPPSETPPSATTRRVDGDALECVPERRVDELDVRAEWAVDAVPGVVARVECQQRHAELFGDREHVVEVARGSSTAMQQHQQRHRSAGAGPHRHIERSVPKLAAVERPARARGRACPGGRCAVGGDGRAEIRMTMTSDRRHAVTGERARDGEQSACEPVPGVSQWTPKRLSFERSTASSRVFADAGPRSIASGFS